MSPTRASWALALAGLAAAAAAWAGPVADGLQRPAMMTAHASSAVLIGAAKAGERLVAVGERGIAVWSDDAGRTWQQASTPVSVTLTAVRFADAATGYAVGHGGVVLATADGGKTWQRRLDGAQAAAIALKQARQGGGEAALRSAQRLVEEGADKPLLDLYVFDARRVLVVGAYNLAFYSDDGGASWQSWMDRLDNPRALHLYAVRVRGDAVLIAGEQGLVLRSDDGGASYRRVATPYGGSFFTAELSGPREILLGGLRGNVWRSADAGASWHKLALPRQGSVTSSFLQRDAGVVLATQDGQLLQVPAGGDEVRPLTTDAPALPPTFNAVLPLDAHRLLALPGHGFAIMSLNAGSDR